MSYSRWSDRNPWYVWWGNPRDARRGSPAARHKLSQTVYVWHISQREDDGKQIAVTFQECCAQFDKTCDRISRATGCPHSDIDLLVPILSKFMEDVRASEPPSKRP